MAEERKACLLLHGFTGAPYEVEPLARYLEQYGWDCHLPTLAGHGGDLRQLRPVTRKDWIDSARETADNLTQTYDSFDLIGFSMSGLIAAFLANRYPVRRLILLNAAVYYVSPARFTASLFHRAGANLVGWRPAKNRTPMTAVMQFMRLVHDLKPELGRVQVPTMVVQGGLDPVIHPHSSIYIMRKLSGEKELHVYPKARHLICLDTQCSHMFADVEQFLSKT